MPDPIDLDFLPVKSAPSLEELLRANVLPLQAIASEYAMRFMEHCDRGDRDIALTHHAAATTIAALLKAAGLPGFEEVPEANARVIKSRAVPMFWSGV